MRIVYLLQQRPTGVRHEENNEGAPAESATCWRQSLTHAFVPDSPLEKTHHLLDPAGPL
jgi:hypothetical protein